MFVDGQTSPFGVLWSPVVQKVSQLLEDHECCMTTFLVSGLGVFPCSSAFQPNRLRKMESLDEVSASGHMSLLLVLEALQSKSYRDPLLWFGKHFPLSFNFDSVLSPRAANDGLEQSIPVTPLYEWSARLIPISHIRGIFHIGRASTCISLRRSYERKWPFAVKKKR